MVSPYSIMISCLSPNLSQTTFTTCLPLSSYVANFLSFQVFQRSSSVNQVFTKQFPIPFTFRIRSRIIKLWPITVVGTLELSNWAPALSTYLIDSSNRFRLSCPVRSMPQQGSTERHQRHRISAYQYQYLFGLPSPTPSVTNLRFR